MVVDTHLYDILGVDPSIDDRSLKKAYAKKALECHPDKHPDDPDATEKFQQLNEAWEILKDPERRRIYDQYGLEGLREQSPGGGFDDILAHLFGFGTSGPSHARSRPRTRDITQEISVSLEELFNGAEKVITAQRRVPCKACQASGHKPDVTPVQCEKCDGQGRVVAIQDIGGSYLRSVVTCPDCHGRGEIIPEDGVCEQCEGRCLEVEEKEYSVHIERGMEQNDKIVFHGAADEVPQADTGDLIVIVNEEPHSRFERKHRDLMYKKELSLSEALLGAKFVIEHLDGRKVVVVTDSKKVIEPGTVQVVSGEGMPLKNDHFHRGDLFIQYSLVLPERKALTREFRHALLKVVPLVDESKDLDLQAEDVTVVTPQEAELEQFLDAKKERKEQRSEAYRDEDENDNDEEEGNEGGEQVGCQPM